MGVLCQKRIGVGLILTSCLTMILLIMTTHNNPAIFTANAFDVEDTSYIFSHEYDFASKHNLSFLSGLGLFSKHGTDTVRDTKDILVDEFKNKLSHSAVKKINITSPCKRPGLLNNSCTGPCLKTEIDQNVTVRVSQISESFKNGLSLEYQKVLYDMAKQVNGSYDVVIASGASDNHFPESQGFIENIHQNIFPLLKNFTFIFYDLGLSYSNRVRLKKYCKCQVLDFPFDKFPEFFRTLTCYSWKPAIINAHAGHSDVFIWADSSVRFQKDSSIFFNILHRARQRGLQLYGTQGVPSYASRTMPNMFHIFGDEPCVYFDFNEIQGGFGFYSKEFFVRKLILDPWMSCALDRTCMCPVPMPELNAQASIQAYHNWKAGKSPMVYGLCHRFDQSALNILVAKLYRERIFDVVMENSEVLFERTNLNSDYFKRLNKKEPWWHRLLWW